MSQSGVKGLIPEVFLCTLRNQEENKTLEEEERKNRVERRKIGLLRLKERLMRRQEQKKNRERKYDMSTMWRETTSSVSL